MCDLNMGIHSLHLNIKLCVYSWCHSQMERRDPWTQRGKESGDSPAARSKILHCRAKLNDMLISEADTAAGKMPVANWLETAALLPLVGKFYPDFSKLLQYMHRKKHPAASCNTLPGEQLELYKNLKNQKSKA